MAHPRVDIYRGREEDTRTPELESRDFTYARGGATTTEEADRYNTTTAFESSPTYKHGGSGRSTIVFKTHDGDGYVLPFLSWEATKTQIEEIYRFRHHQTLAESVKEGKFSMMTEDGNIILPSLWNQVVEPAATVQIVLPSDNLKPDTAAYYPYEDEVRPRHRPRSPSVGHSNDNAMNSDAEDARDNVEDDEDYASGSEEDSYFESTSSGSETSESPAPTEVTVDAARQVTTPTDDDVYNLIFKVNTAFIRPLDRDTATVNDASNKREPQQPVGNTESVSIAKAVLTQADGRTWLQIHPLPGPRATSTHPDISIRWFHLRSGTLDLNGFKETCLSIPGLSNRRQELVRKIFERVEKEKLKVLLDGMFIEPGTVLRVDESHRSGPESVIFSCVPYFDLQIPVKTTSTAGQANRCSSRTLMQSYYPYEPVQDRDAEQAYRKFDNEQRNALVHVPNIWMVNIGSDIVATCGHQALYDGFVQSIKIVEMDRNRTKGEGDLSTNIRLTDWDGRKLLYTVGECRSYFQMEQRLRELQWCPSRSRYEKSLQLSWQTKGGQIKVTPGLWAGILKQRNDLFIDLSLLDDTEGNNMNDAVAQLQSPTVLLPKPFFHWPQKTGASDVETGSLISDEVKRSIGRLEHVEKALMSEVLSSYGSYGAVEKTFTSTEYYRALSQSTAEHVKTTLQSLPAENGNIKNSNGTGLTLHHSLVIRQHNAVAQKTSELCECMHKTLALFVADVDKSAMLRKSWAAIQSVCDIAITIRKREPLSFTLTDSEQTRYPTAQRGWLIRPHINDEVASKPLKKLKRSFEKCRKCSMTEMYKTSQAALSHLRNHLKHVDSFDLSTLSTEDWIVNYAQMKMEVWNEGSVAILTKACQTAQQLFNQAKELSDGVCNEDRQMSNLYTFPRPLLGAFRQVVVFYFAVERALFYTEESFKDETNPFGRPEYMATLPFSSSGLQAIEVFGNGVQQALAATRNELCSMVKSSGPVEIFRQLSLSSEYVCGWFMRRLIVKPLDKGMTASDMYREYLSTIQFQVNHRPGKRLLRSINLIQEEIAALQEVNTQQSKLISNYMSVLDDTTYKKDNPSRSAMFPYERMLLESCQDNLKMMDQEYRYSLARCGPLSDSTKQSLEINEEDHGKAILVFTVVTVIFLPLSFVTSFLGMNTTDIRDMSSSSTLFWAIAIPLTAVTMGSVLYIGYNGDDLRDAFESLYRTVTGKQDRSISARGISVAQRRLARRSATDSNSALDFSSLADEAEFANPRPDDYYRSAWRDAPRPPRRQYTFEQPTMQWEPYASATNPVAPEPRTGLRTQPLKLDDYAPRLRGRYGRRTSEYLNPEVRYTGTRPNVTIYNTNRKDEPEAQRYNEPVMMEIPPTSPPPVRRRPREEEDDWYTGRQPTGPRHSVPPPQYEWTKKSHRHHRSTRDRPRRSREDRVDKGDDYDDWYDRYHAAAARHVGARPISAQRIP